MAFDVLPELKHLGFAHAARWEHRATAHVRVVAHTAGGRRSRRSRDSDQVGARIRAPDLDRTDTITVEDKPAPPTAIHASPGLLAGTEPAIPCSTIRDVLAKGCRWQTQRRLQSRRRLRTWP